MFEYHDYAHPHPVACGEETHSDYYPLSEDEVRTFLLLQICLSHRRKDTHDPNEWGPLVRTFTSIHIRLEQALPGATCPHKADEKSRQLSKLVGNYRTEPLTQDFLDQVMALLKPEEETHV